jgi:DNA-binding NtrC family response regulator
MSKVLNILIIEDDKYTRLELKDILSKYGIISEAKNIDEALEVLTKEKFDLIITDIELEDRSGIEIIPQVVKSGAYCIVVSSYKEEDIIEAAYHLGVKHYLSKAKLRELLPIYVNKYLQDKNLHFEKIITQSIITEDENLIGKLRGLCEINWKNRSLLITGSTGTGKTHLGKIIHEITNPKSNLVHLNCSEIPELLLESELFGHEKGAFTGADTKKDGKLLLAKNGTLFLDEIGTMSLGMQQKLLKAIDEKTFYPVGSNTPITSEFTLIAATCEDIKEKIAKKEFREDLYFRISGHHFHMPDLKNRINDIEPLVRFFQEKSYRKFIIKKEAYKKLKDYEWPGNIRELGRVCDKMSDIKSGIITEEIISTLLGCEVLNITEESFPMDKVFEIGLRHYIKILEKVAVQEALKKNQNKVSACIKDLKISSSAFYRIIEENNIPQ